ncbi:hypothetical protein COV11_04890 [Candidatus Woesearchaeota archaeon CG10_big_fil_rev_8_21_14_0_10_30_7]|nr:MAG: hypothetical protein COV11_04890 [Candidatus Woesearchaeota archaeon CG10_big_fil_rev_8_21_14_0_10_30_7]
MVENFGRINYELVNKKIKLDVKDKKILSLLAQNARMPLTQISKLVQLSRDAVDYRIKRLVNDGVILKFFSHLNHSKLGFYKYHVFLLLDESNKKNQKEFILFLVNHPNIFSVIEYSDRWDLEVRLIAKDVIDFDKIIMDIAAKFPDVILERDKLEVIRKYKSTYLPPLVEDKTVTKILEERSSPEKLDDMDIKILKLLSVDCRISTYAIADKVKLSADAVSYRIKNLVDKGIIRKFTIMVNFSVMQYHMYTFTMQLKMFDKKTEKKFEEFLKQHKNILRAIKTLGSWDLLMYVVVSDPGEFHKIVKEVKDVFSEVVRNYQTWIAYKEHVFKTMPEIIQ